MSSYTTQGQASSADSQAESAEDVSTPTSIFETIQSEFRKLVDLIAVSAGAASSLGQLAAAELALAASMIPRIAAAAILLIPLGILLWIGICVTLGYAGFAFWGSPLAGLLIFTGLQLLAVLVLIMKIKSWKRRMRFSKTRGQIDTITEAIKNESGAHGHPA